MPDLDWDTFVGLPGAVTRNWELLSREVVRRNYAQFGEFRSTSQQPGVEFHLRLEQKCSLGEASRWWGWQCRWYDIVAGQQIGKKRQADIEDAIHKSEKYLPNLTDWVLLTRRQLTPADQKWYESLKSKTKLRLHLWSALELENLLCGEAAILRSVYFGELVLTPSQLANLHEIATEPVKHRWDPALHVEPNAEQKLRRILAERNRWRTLRVTAKRLTDRASLLESTKTTLYGDELSQVEQILSDCVDTANNLTNLADAIDSSRIDDARLAAVDKPEIASTHRFAQLVRNIRVRKIPPALYLPALATECDYAQGALDSTSRFLNTSLVAVIGKAGAGKTFIGAQITSATSEGRPAGVFLMGRWLGASQGLDSLLTGLVGAPFTTFDQLLESLNTAGARAGCRLPIVIDGLNESENPRDWKDILASLHVRLRSLPNVLVIVTLRSSVKNDALPEDVPRIKLRGFKFIVNEAVEKYFQYYKINSVDAAVPYNRFANPLFLRLFCVATNPSRDKWVGVESIPGSLSAVFDKYLDVATERVARDLKRQPIDVSKALENVALAMWDRKTRNLRFEELRELVGDDPNGWARSLARALEEEGVLYRDPDNMPGFQRSGIQYDAFAGHLIAGALIDRIGQQRFDSWINERITTRALIPVNSLPPRFLDKALEKLKPCLPKRVRHSRWFYRLTQRPDHSHTLATDILSGFAGLLPRRFHRQLWPQLGGPLRDVALIEAAQLEGKYIDDSTKNELETLVLTKPDRYAAQIFVRCFSARRSPHHPLNAKFLDCLLRRMDVSSRDLHWSEWLREHRDELVKDTQAWDKYWKKHPERLPDDENLATWMAWILTSNVPLLRDLATRALYRFGCYAPESLFNLALASNNIDDPAIMDRLFAASYGAVMASAAQHEEIAPACNAFLGGLAKQLFGTNPAQPTNHWLVREYVNGVFEFAKLHFANKLDGETMKALDGGFASAPHVIVPSSTPADTESDLEFEHEFGIERHNIGSLAPLAPNDYNYPRQTAALQEAMKWMRYRVSLLSHNNSRLFDIDNRISRDKWNPSQRNERAKAIPYREKYAKIAFFEMAGFLEQQGKLERDPYSCNRMSEVDIDPSFPVDPPRLPTSIPTWISDQPEQDHDWMRSGKIEVPDALLRTDKLRNQAGPWVAVSGYIGMRDPISKRGAFGFVRGILVSSGEIDPLLKILNEVDYPGNDFVPSDPDDHYVFAGEIPWSHHFASGIYEQDGPKPYDQSVGSFRGPKIVVETLAHRYSWEDYHSELNRAGGNLVPSKAISHNYNLRRIPPSFDHVEPDGRLASLTLSTPSDFGQSSVLYLREDLLLDHAAKQGRELIWIVWGERNVYRGYRGNTPQVQAVYNEHAHIWRRIVKHSELLR